MDDVVPEGILSSVDTGEKTVISVADVEAAMQRFGRMDYVMFLLMLLICVAIGLFFGFCRKSKSTQDYLVGNRSMRVVPVALSLVAR